MALTNEDLLAISQLLDVKLKAEVQPIKNEIHTLRDEMQDFKTELHAEIQAVETSLRAEMQNIKTELHVEIQAVETSLRAEMQNIETNLHAEIQAVEANLHAEIQAVETNLHAEIQAVETNLHAEILQITLFQENKLMPRLNTIEACYTSTYNKYKDSVEGYEALQADNEIMKQVIMDHSEQLKKLA